MGLPLDYPIRATDIPPKPQYAIAGTWREFYAWKQRHPEFRVSYLTKERAELMIAKGAAKGTLHRIGTWETSPAREAAERLER